MEKNAPHWLKHKPIVTVGYEKKDEAHDAKYLSIGRSTWSYDDYSAKVWRKSETGRWSRQSEDLPLWRVLDLATLLVAVINGKQSNLEEFVQDSNKIGELKEFLNENKKSLYAPRIAELKKMLEDTDLMETEDAIEISN